MKPDDLTLDTDHPIRSNKARGTRIVYRGKFKEQPAIIKTYSGLPKAWLHWKTCLIHGRALRARNIPAPKIYWAGWNKDLKAFIIVYEYLVKAEDFMWMRRNSDFSSRWIGYQNLLSLFALMHSLGIEQSDTTAGNFLQVGDKTYAIDEDRMNIRIGALNRRRSLRNISSMLTQYPVLSEDELHKIYLHYCSVRGWGPNGKDFKRLSKMTNLFRLWRKDKKAYRRRIIGKWLLALIIALVVAITTQVMFLN